MYFLWVERGGCRSPLCYKVFGLVYNVYKYWIEVLFFGLIGLVMSLFGGWPLTLEASLFSPPLFLRFNNVTVLFILMTLRYLMECDFECHKRIWLFLLDTNWFLDEIVKCPIQQTVSRPRSWIRVVGASCWGLTMPMLCSLGRLLDTLQSVISNAIKGFGFTHWTPIDFQMRRSKARSNTYIVVWFSVTRYPWFD